jgi:hypothetical protein
MTERNHPQAPSLPPSESGRESTNDIPPLTERAGTAQSEETNGEVTA